MPHRSSHVPCISCTDTNLALRERSGISYFQCDQCESVWLREPEFLSLMEEVRPGQDNELLVHNDGSERRRCPICVEDMEIAWMLFLQMDRCEDHGIWFDPGELDRALAGDDGSEVLDQVGTQVKRRKGEEAKRPKPGKHQPWMSALKKIFR